MQSGGVWAYQPMTDMSIADFRSWQKLLEERSGVVVSDQRRAFVQANLSARMRELGLASYDAYYQRVLSGPQGAVEWALLMDRLTVQETCFFRHAPSFALLNAYLLERLELHERALNLWSVGCSSGEEPYSLAITVKEALVKSQRDLGFGVHATDLSLRALEKARAARYPAKRLALIDPDLRERYFVAHPEGEYSVSPQLAAHVCCARLNVLELAHAPLSGMDVIFCQNLLIYFRRWRRREILNHLAERLAPGGLLVIGVGEIVGWQHPDLTPVADKSVLAFIRKSL